MDGLAAPRQRLALPRPRLRAASDERLVAQVRGSDEAASRNAFEVLYDRHHRSILAFCRHMLGSPEEAEDAVQHTFGAAYHALLRDQRAIALRAWLFTIARNRCLSMLAARRDQVALDDVGAVLPATVGLAHEVEQRGDLRDLLADLQRLPDDQRAALLLAELEAHSHSEIAAILDVPPAKVKALVFQARETLMIRRAARDADCGDIREQLSILRGGALRRREIRRHIEVCAGCRDFEAEVRRQRASMALLLPVVPTIALKQSSLAAAFTTGTAGAATGTAAVGGGVAGGMAIGAKVIGAKALAIIAVAGTAGGGGYVAVQEATPPRSAPAIGQASPAGSSQGGAARTVGQGRPVVTPAAGPASASAGERRAADEKRAERGPDGATAKDRDRGAGSAATGKGGRGADGRAADPAARDKASSGKDSNAGSAARKTPARKSGSGTAKATARARARARARPKAKGVPAAQNGEAGSKKDASPPPPVGDPPVAPAESDAVEAPAPTRPGSPRSGD